jgi:hypothetical protein
MLMCSGDLSSPSGLTVAESSAGGCAGGVDIAVFSSWLSDGRKQPSRT